MTPLCDRKRRALIAAIASAPLLSSCANDAMKKLMPELVVTLTGQALIAHNMCAVGYPGFAEVVAEIRRGDIAMTDLETAIRTFASGPATRQGTFLHAAGVPELACVKQMGFGALALANNHAGDFGRDGVLATLDEVRKQGLAAAGTGKDLADAGRAAHFGVKGQRIALVAMAAGKIQKGAAAENALPGVNELRLTSLGEPDSADLDRILQSIRAAASRSDYVVAYLHNHDWRGDMSVTQEWTRRFAKSSVDAGASAFFAHGAPMLHGVELYRGAPLFYGLGSLIFHSRTAPGFYRHEVWQSAIVHLTYRGGKLVHIELVPVALNEIGDDPAEQDQTRGRPRIADGREAQAILERMQQISAPYGTQFQIHGGYATILLER